MKDSVSTGLVGTGEGETAGDPVWGVSVWGASVWGASVWGMLEVCSDLEAGVSDTGLEASSVLDSTTSVSQGTVRVTVLWSISVVITVVPG